MNKIQNFQKLIKKHNLDAYIIPTSDYHNSEYISSYFKGRQYLSGFDGSAGTLIVTKDQAFLWTDGRYYIQAAKQIENKPIELMKQGTIDVPTINDFLQKTLLNNSVLGFDGKVVSTNFALNLIKDLPNIVINSNLDLIGEFWQERPSLPLSQLFILDLDYSGMTFENKLSKIRREMQKLNADAHIICSLEDQAWLYNLRGNDVQHTPVFLAYTYISNDECHIFIDNKKIDSVVRDYLDSKKIIIHEYFEFYDFIKKINNNKILMDFNKVNYTIYLELSKHDNTFINALDPSLMMKAIKNDIEIKNTINAHIKDGVAFTKFMHFLKTNIKTGQLSEISVSDYLEKERKKQNGFVDLSFNTICAYKEHAAMMHYSATKNTDYHLETNGLILIDSGGHYLEGTTDITRTISLGKISQDEKKHFTLVLKAMINLSNAIFLEGCTGQNLDILARGPIWKELLDYKCGTGHGVGYLLSVHEAPNGFRWKKTTDRNDSAILRPGMITTNEPGIYLENKYGIRIENEMLCINKGSNEFGNFLGFQTITFAPIDLDAIEVTLLNNDEKKWLNQYHNDVFNTISPYLNNEEKEWLKLYTREI